MVVRSGQNDTPTTNAIWKLNQTMSDVEARAAGRTIAIGDIHGCSTALAALLNAIEPTADDLIITLGDYVDRGPDSRGVVQQVIDLAQQVPVVPLLGNHEIMMLDALRGGELQFWLDCGGAQTVASYNGGLESIPDAHRSFLRSCRRFYETENHIFVHANYDRNLPLDQQPDDLLFWTHLSYYLPGRHRSGKTAIVGHTPQPDGSVMDLGYLLAIDTCCFGGLWLTAVDVDSTEIWQTNNDGQLREE